jgi:hypothetical protein
MTPDQGEQDCRREEMAYRAWLGVLTPLKWTCVSGGVVFSAAAGVSILWEALPHGKAISAALAFSASALTGLHSALKCDAHQSECHRLIQAFRSLGTQYAASKSLGPPERVERRNALNIRLGQLIETATARPASWCYDRADRAIHRNKADGM